ncbi:MAG: RidA family protein [Halobacteriaceae archaeon]
MQDVTTDGAPVYEELPFSQAIVHGDTVYVSGQVPVDPETGEIVGEDIREQTRRTMENVAAVLEAAGSSLDSIVKATVFLADIDDFAAFNEVYSEYVSGPEPARSAFEVGDLAIDVTVEIEVVAALE